ncbi:FAD-dependent oxidoreductase [Thiohalocapsa marina]|uniref:FAD-dependent oxidoreductase n=1 Tax=Thiohalocapsa marina TaxID=424902 RepID=A0A5M8FVV1_9GAMM|nr:FAD-dependent oxidoreductase [Thiohalocapsa marina]KAA6187829.1 FAD-dependent oxidoreductase [Thiohalocapsa marina]
MSERIAVIGSGIAGLASAWLLARQHQVTLIEANDYIGGHTHTIEVPTADGPLPVDTGFIVFNEPNYPLLTRLFRRLGVASRESTMSFSASIGPGRLEYSGDTLNTLFAQRGNLLSPGFLRMLRDMLRFNRRCKALLADGGFDGLSLGDFLQRQGLGTEFQHHYLLPMAAAIWSCPTGTMMDFPAESLARFFNNHGLLNILRRPEWRTVVGGSHSYVKRILSDLGEQHVLFDAAQQVRTRGDEVEVRLGSGAERRFDRVVLACHADQALALLERPDDDTARLLGAFRYQTNRTWLHTDAQLMPRRRAVWASWNYLAEQRQDGERAVSVTYWMNRLQGLPGTTDYLVSLNPLQEPEPERVIAAMDYEHPVFDQAAMDAQRQLHRLQGRDRVHYCGSYFGYGFHEDALKSAVDVADQLGIDTRWLTTNTADTDPTHA